MSFWFVFDPCTIVRHIHAFVRHAIHSLECIIQVIGWLFNEYNRCTLKFLNWFNCRSLSMRKQFSFVHPTHWQRNNRKIYRSIINSTSLLMAKYEIFCFVFFFRRRWRQRFFEFLHDVINKRNWLINIRSSVGTEKKKPRKKMSDTNENKKKIGWCDTMIGPEEMNNIHKHDH